MMTVVKAQWHLSNPVDPASGPAEAPEVPAVGVSTPGPRALPPPRERRASAKDLDQLALRSGLTDKQLEGLATLEMFGWTLRFVRRPMFLAPIPIIFAPDGGRFVVLEHDGVINENPGFKIRP